MPHSCPKTVSTIPQSTATHNQQKQTHQQRTTDCANPCANSTSTAQTSPPDHPAFTWNASILGRWMELVPEYTCRALTVPTDALSAITGIITRMTVRTGDMFLAGLWRSTLHVELLWIAYDAPHKSPLGQDAPSWSWAALEGNPGISTISMGGIICRLIWGCRCGSALGRGTGDVEVAGC